MGRKRIGIIYRGGKGWIGGVYYIQNVISALNYLNDDDKPVIDVYTSNKRTFVRLREITKYPYLNCYHGNEIILLRLYRKGCRFLLRRLSSFCGLFSFNIKQRITIEHIYRKDIFIFPRIQGNPNRLLAWIPDFQEKHLPQMFEEKLIQERNRTNEYVAKHIKHLVLSSHSCEDDFKIFYPDYKCQIHVLHFAVTLPDYSAVNIETLKKEYSITGKYLFCPNQFWKHKNHLFLFKAYKKALDRGLDMDLVCTGQLSDYRNPDYIQQLKEFISNNNLEKKIKILGFISRENMLCLIKNSYAMVQPSLFEGWSTVVEDAKAVNKFIFLSDLSVHREQIDKNVCFFNPHDEDDLCNKFLTVKPSHEPRDYKQNIREFGQNFLNIINSFN